MGLAAVHGIVKDLGGDISAYSEPEKGTTFQVLLPKYEGEEGVSYTPDTVVQKGKGRILFVDDEMSIVLSMCKILEQLGYEVVTTTSALGALELFKAKPDDFDLVLTDFTMPAMTGLELSKRLIEIKADITIVMCTGFSAGLTEEMVKNAGIREIVMKPMIASELAEAVGKAMNP